MPLPTGHVFFPWCPDFAGSVKDTPTLLTSAASALRGDEDRAAWWTAPRRKLKFSIAARTIAAGFRVVESARLALVAGRASVPHWGRGNPLTVFAVGSAAVTTERAHGFVAGDMVSLLRPTAETATLAEIATAPTTTTLTLTAAIPAGWDTDEVWILRVLHGRIAGPGWSAIGASELRSLGIDFQEFPPAPAPVPDWQAESPDFSHLWGPPAKFVLYLCLDETGSIGTAGAQRGLNLIELYADRLAAVGFCSFGDVIRKDYAITATIADVIDYLQDVVDGVNPAHDEFFGDGGGDTPENGVDALAAALAAHTAFVSDLPRLVALKTDTWGFAHNAAAAATVLTGLTALDGVWLEFNRNGSHDGTSYAATFPQTTKLRHSPFPDPL